MSYTLEDAEREDGESRIISSVIDEYRDNIVAEFVEDRLASYFEEHPDLDQHARDALVEAKSLAVLSASAATVLALSSVELAIQDVLLKPVVSGLTHNPFLCNFIADLIDVRNKQTEKLLFTIMDEVGLPSLKDQALPSGRLVWKEKQELQELRNRVVHRGVKSTDDEASRALALAEYFLDDIYPKVRDFFTHRSSGYV